MEEPVKICDLMHKGVIFCYPDDNLKEIAKMMYLNHFRSVVVLHESGEVWGLVSIMDMIRHYGENLESFSAEDVMQPFQIKVDPQWPIEKAIDLMIKDKFEHLIIVDPHAGMKQPIGILSSSDIVRYISHIEIGHFQHLLKLASDAELS
jgi:CBS domain-containing protein